MKMILVSISLFMLQKASAQIADSTFRRNEQNVYFQAIDQYLDFVRKESAKTDTLYLESGDKITDSLLSECHNTKLVRLNDSQLKEVIKKRKSLNLYRIKPLEPKDGKYAVTLIPFGCGFNKAKKRYVFLHSGNYIVLFKFDGERFIFEKLEEHGI